MKDKIFIGWSGSDEIALRVKDILEKRCNYKCAIGGNSANDSSYSSVGDTVIQQIKNCNQAIIIFQNRADGQVSNNLFFELGYTLASYGTMKIHCVKRAGEKVVLPSDFDSAFVEAIDDSDDDAFASGIVKYFLLRQKMSVNTNKMQLIDNRYITRGIIQRHFSEEGSKCSDYELAQYILFYMQAAYMFGDMKLVQSELLAFKQANQYNFSNELAFSVNTALAYFDLALSIKQNADGSIYIEKTDYRKFKDRALALYEEIKDEDTGIFDNWARVFVSNHINYANSVYCNNPELSEERKAKVAGRVCEWTETCLAAIERLTNDPIIIENNDHIGLLSLIKAYVYRNRFLAAQRLKEPDYLKWLKLTMAERISLKKHFDYGSIDTHLKDNLDMEYYLSLIEYLQYAEELDIDEDDEELYLDDINSYLEREKNVDDRNKYIDRISFVYSSLSDKLG